LSEAGRKFSKNGFSRPRKKFWPTGKVQAYEKKFGPTGKAYVLEKFAPRLDVGASFKSSENLKNHIFA
jgi:hypothetical protein